MYDFIIFTADVTVSLSANLGMRALGPHKVTWIARQHDYKAITLSKVHQIPKDELLEILKTMVGPKTVFGIGTGFMMPLRNKDRIGDNGMRTLNSILECIDYFREKWQNKLVLGGLHSESYVDFFKANHWIGGKAENEIITYLNSVLRSGIQRKPNDWDIRNCTYKWSDLDFIDSREALPIEMARGCIFSCKFCGWEDVGKKVGSYERSMDNIKDELIHNYEQYGTQNYWITSDTFNDNDDRMNQWCDMVESLPFRIQYSCFMRLDLAMRFKNTTRRLWETGLRGAHFGVESFHPIASKAIGKAYSGKNGKAALDYLYNEVFEQNFMVTTSMIIGLPGEKEEDILKSVDWYKERPHIDVVFIALALIDPTKTTEYQLKQASPFSKEPSLYGYSFPSENLNYWENDLMTYHDALRIMKECNSVVYKTKNTINSWEAALYWSVTNKSPKEILSGDPNKIKQECQPIFDDITSSYFKKVKKYHNVR